MREHVGLGGARAVDAGSGNDLEVLVEAEMGEDALRGRLRLGGGYRQSDTGGPQIRDQWPDAVEEAVDRPTAGGVVGAVGGDGRLGVLAQSHRLKGVVHRRADDLTGQVAL